MSLQAELRSANPLNEPICRNRMGSLKGFFIVPKEIWKPIPRCEGYEASSLGRIRKSEQNKILVIAIGTKGYLRVSIVEDGVRRNRLVHRLVARAFHGEPTAPMALHKNGIKTDNTPRNIYYGTAKQNSQDALKHGTQPLGENHGRAIFTEKQIISIREEYAKGGTSYRKMAKKYGAGRTTIRLIIIREIWSWLN